VDLGDADRRIAVLAKRGVRGLGDEWYSVREGAVPVKEDQVDHGGKLLHGAIVHARIDLLEESLFLAVRARTHAGHSLEDAAKVVRVVEGGHRGNLLHRSVASAKRVLGKPDTHLLDLPARRHAEDGRERATAAMIAPSSLARSSPEVRDSLFWRRAMVESERIIADEVEPATTKGRRTSLKSGRPPSLTASK
jgi:hypothetical protein